MKIKWGVIGCGGIADRRTMPGMMLADNAELVAVMDINKTFAENCKEKYNAKYAGDVWPETVQEGIGHDGHDGHNGHGHGDNNNAGGGIGEDAGE